MAQLLTNKIIFQQNFESIIPWSTSFLYGLLLRVSCRLFLVVFTWFSFSLSLSLSLSTYTLNIILYLQGLSFHGDGARVFFFFSCVRMRVCVREWVDSFNLETHTCNYFTQKFFFIIYLTISLPPCYYFACCRLHVCNLLMMCNVLNYFFHIFHTSSLSIHFDWSPCIYLLTFLVHLPLGLFEVLSCFLGILFYDGDVLISVMTLASVSSSPCLDICYSDFLVLFICHYFVFIHILPFHFQGIT